MGFMLILIGSKATADTRQNSAVDNSQYIRLRLIKDAINTDETIVFFKANTSPAYVPGEDGVYFGGNGQVNLSSLSSDNVPLVFNIQPIPKTSIAVWLNVKVQTSGIYQLKLQETLNIPVLFDIWLIDTYKNDSLDMRHNSTYAFNVLKTDSNSFGKNRFKMVVRQNAAYAYRLLYFTANKVTDAKQVRVEWQTENEADYTKFTIERSIDNGKVFCTLHGEKIGEAGFYSFLDEAPVIGQNLYRLKQEDINGTITYSNQVQVTYADEVILNPASLVSRNNPSIYPNPAINTVNIVVDEKLKGAGLYNILITNTSGFSVRDVSNAESRWQGEISGLRPGIYFVKVVNSKNNNVVGYSKFIKQ